MDPVYVFLVNPIRAFAIAGVTGFATYWFIGWLAHPAPEAPRASKRAGRSLCPAHQAANPED